MPNTPKLDLLRIQEDWQFADDSFNHFIDDADNKLLGIAHKDSPAHWAKWEENTAYAVGDVVRITNGKSHQYYQCTVAGTSGTVEPMNNVTGSIITNDGTVEWMVMSLSDEATTSSIRIWLSGDSYIRGDCVLYGTAIYRCKIAHIASNWINDNTYWQEVFSSIRLWQPAIYYFVGDTALYDGIIYQCTVAHIAEMTFSSTEEANWVAITDGRIYDWKVSTDYKENDIVSYYDGNKFVLYRCLSDHTSDALDFNTDRSSKWQLFHTPSATIENWVTNKYYEKDQTVLYNDNLYRCTLEHTSTSFDVDDSNWEIIYASIKEWVQDIYYKEGTTVVYSGSIYKCVVDHTSNDFDSEITNWDLISGSGSSILEWEQNTQYHTDDLVVYDGVLYKVTADFISTTTFDATDMRPIMGEPMTDADIDNLWI